MVSPARFAADFDNIVEGTIESVENLDEFGIEDVMNDGLIERKGREGR